MLFGHWALLETTIVRLLVKFIDVVALTPI